MALLIEAGQMTASDYVPTYPDLLLASEGAFSNRAAFVKPCCIYFARVTVLYAVGIGRRNICPVRKGLSGIPCMGRRLIIRPPWL